MQYMETFQKAVENALQKAIDSHKIRVQNINQSLTSLEIKAICEIGSCSWVQVTLNIANDDLEKEGLI